MRREILWLASAYACEFTGCGIGCDQRTQSEFENWARQVTAGTIVRIGGKLDEIGKQTRMHLGTPEELGAIRRELEATRNLAVREGRSRLKRQKIRRANLAGIEQTATGLAPMSCPPTNGIPGAANLEAQQETNRLITIKHTHDRG